LRTYDKYMYTNKTKVLASSLMTCSTHGYDLTEWHLNMVFYTTINIQHKYRLVNPQLSPSYRLFNFTPHEESHSPPPKLKNLEGKIGKL
jgi:hypothetical protein